MRAPEFWRCDGPLPRLLAPLAWGYDLAGRSRRQLVRPRRASVPVICVGNLVAGGAGKTPTALAVAERLAPQGCEVHFLTRGYGGGVRGPHRVDPARDDVRSVGDEALLLAAAAPTWVSPDRIAGARAATAAGAGALVMDDGFQNPGLVKDLALVVVDAGYGFGNRRVLPAGPLRETVARGLDRADAVALVGEDDGAADLEAEIAARGMTILRGRLEPAAAGQRLVGRRVVAFAGIARPDRLFTMLDAIGCRLVARHAFADHHRYTPDEIMRLVEQASAADAVPVTTAKDYVRLSEEARPMVEALDVRLVWRDAAVLDRLLAPLFAAG
ncbi:MAG: tetraacyldisaccharide 4'-kinase [Alphaproteobacteria bacterium]